MGIDWRNNFQTHFKIIIPLQIGPVPTKDMQTLRSGHLEIKDAQCTENEDVSKFSWYIISRLGVVGVQKGRFGCLKFQFFSKNGKICSVDWN